MDDETSQKTVKFGIRKPAPGIYALNLSDKENSLGIKVNLDQCRMDINYVGKNNGGKKVSQRIGLEFCGDLSLESIETLPDNLGTSEKKKKVKGPYAPGQGHKYSSAVQQILHGYGKLDQKITTTSIDEVVKTGGERRGLKRILSGLSNHEIVEVIGEKKKKEYVIKKPDLFNKEFQLQ